MEEKQRNLTVPIVDRYQKIATKIELHKDMLFARTCCTNTKVKQLKFVKQRLNLKATN